MDRREQALAELKRQMQQARTRLGPERLRAWAEILEGKSVPYDRDAARRALELFLSRHPDREGMKKKILALLTQPPDGR